MSAIQNRLQPQGQIQIDWDHPITKGLAFAYVVNGQNIVGWSVGNNNARVIPASGTQLMQKIGKTLFTSGTTIIDTITSGLSGSTNYGLFAYGTNTSTGVAQNAIDDDNQAGGQRAFQFRINSAKVELIVFNTGSTPFFATGPTLSVATMAMGVAMGASVAGNSFASFSNGLKTSGTATGTQKTPNATVALGNNKTAAQSWGTGGLGLFVGWSRTPTDAEQFSMAANPWQLFIDPLRVFTFPSTAVAATTNQCITSFNQISKVRW